MTTALVDVAVWTADCSATVQLSRCAGPTARGVVGRTAAPPCWVDAHGDDRSRGLDLAEPTDQAQLYECCLGGGTPFDIYRWINLDDLARLWPMLRLPAGVRAEWGGALRGLGLLDGR